MECLSGCTSSYAADKTLRATLLVESLRYVLRQHQTLSDAAGLFGDPAYGPVLANYGLENLRFTKPAYPGDTIQARLTVKVAISSTVLCMLSLPEARIGLVVNAMLLAAVIMGKRVQL